jgi:hypothetical protein
MNAQEPGRCSHGLRDMGVFETETKQTEDRDSRRPEKKTSIPVEENGSKLHRQSFSEVAQKGFSGL